MIVEYYTSKECKNDQAWCTCCKCGKCGRIFKGEFLVDEGNTTIDEEDQE